MMKKTLLSLSVLLGLGSFSAHAETLLDVYNTAKQNDAVIQAAAAGREAGQEAIPQARSVLLPQVTGSAEYSKDNYDSSSARNQFDANGNLISRNITSSSDTDTNGWRLDLSQQIYHYDSWVALSQAEKSVQRSDLEYTAAQQNLIVRVAQAYFDVLFAEDNLTYVRSNKEAIGRQLEQTKQRFNVGLIAITDVHEAQARYDEAVSQEVVAKNQLDTANESLREITARYYDSLAKLSGDIPLASPAPASVDDWIKFSESQNPSLNAQKLTTDIARDEVKRRFGGHLPTLDLVASYSDTSTSGDVKSQGIKLPADNDQDGTTVGVRFSVPLFSGGRTQSQVNEGESLFVQASQQLEATHRSVVKDTKTAYLGVEASIAAVQALKQSVVSSKSALEATQAGFEVGTRTIVDVLNSTQAVFLAERNLAQAKYTYLLNGLRLKQAGGILKEEDLAAVSALLR